MTTPTDDIEPTPYELAKEVAIAAIYHLNDMYPAALKAVPKTATLSLRNFITEQAALRIESALEAERKRAVDGPLREIDFDPATSESVRRCDSTEAKWVLNQFGLDGAEEDNHVPYGKVRNFWRTVAAPLIGLDCACKEEEPAFVEDKGDFVWRP